MSKTFYGALGRTYEWPDLHPSIDPTGMSYDDVLLPPGADTDIEKRGDVDISVQFGPFKLETPIIAAPMDTICGETMIRALHALGGLGTMPRNGNFAENLALMESLATDDINCVPSIGTKDAFREAQLLKERGAKMVLIDTAHGGQKKLLEIHQEIREKLDICVMLGNIATYQQGIAYKKAGVEFPRVGVGGGGFCTTRLVAATGVPQLTAVFETVGAGLNNVVADGGIKYPGDVAKAITAGANIVMIGSMFAGTDEAPGKEIINELGQKFKEARGQASRSYMDSHKVEVTKDRAPEGISTQVPLKGPVKALVDEITGGLRSAMSYHGAHSLAELQAKGIFIHVSHAAQQEAQPHIIQQIQAPGRKK